MSFIVGGISSEMEKKLKEIEKGKQTEAGGHGKMSDTWEQKGYKQPCSDCNGTVEDFFKHKVNICDACWDNRLNVIKAYKDGVISQEQFTKFQKAIQGRSFRAPLVAKELLHNHTGGRG